jgi:hypothetical protein
MRIPLLIASILLVGCGDDGAIRPDATMIVQPDAAPRPCTATPMYGTVTPADEAASRDADTNPTEIFYDASLNADVQVDNLSIQLFKELGVFTTGEIVAGPVALTGAEVNYETCGACVLIYTDVDPDSGMEDSVYMATGGTLNLMGVTPNIRGTLSNVTFTHVTIDADTYASTPVGDCDATLTSLEFNIPVITDTK